MVFCRWWEEVEGDSMRGEICPSVNMVRERYSKTGNLDGVEVLKYLLDLCTDWFWVVH